MDENNTRKVAPINDCRKRSAARAPSHLADFKYKLCLPELFIVTAVVN